MKILILVYQGILRSQAQPPPRWRCVAQAKACRPHRRATHGRRWRTFVGSSRNHKKPQVKMDGKWMGILLEISHKDGELHPENGGNVGKWWENAVEILAELELQEMVNSASSIDIMRCIYIYEHKYAYTHVRVCVCVRVYIPMYVCLYVYLLIRLSIYSFICLSIDDYLFI